MPAVSAMDISRMTNISSYTINSVFTVSFYSYCFRNRTQALDYQGSIRADDKVVIVTGANSGIGLETARELAKRGAKVYMACRDLNKCNKALDSIIETTSNPLVYCRECDLSSQNSIRKFVQKLVSNTVILHTEKS